MNFPQVQITLARLLTGLLIGLNLFGCAKQPPSSNDQAQSSELSPIPTKTIIDTPVVNLTETPTDTPHPTQTLTPLPTLEPTLAMSTLRQLLLEQPFCQFPCFWGVEPTQTSLGEAQNIFASLGIPLTYTLREEDKDFYSTVFGLENGLAVSIVLRVHDGIVDSSKTGIGFANYNDFSNSKEWVAFSPETILAQYGPPTYVEFYLSSPPCGDSSCKISYSMTMYFDMYDLVVQYDSRLLEDQQTIEICPLSDEYEGVSAWLGKNAENVPTRRGVSLEKSTDLTLEQFYSSILQNPSTSCFDLSRDTIR